MGAHVGGQGGIELVEARVGGGRLHGHRVEQPLQAQQFLQRRALVALLQGDRLVGQRQAVPRLLLEAVVAHLQCRLRVTLLQQHIGQVGLELDDGGLQLRGPAEGIGGPRQVALLLEGRGQVEMRGGQPRLLRQGLAVEDDGALELALPLQGRAQAAAVQRLPRLQRQGTLVGGRRPRVVLLHLQHPAQVGMIAGLDVPLCDGAAYQLRRPRVITQLV